jgi:Methyltransferase domain/C-methyltransferase C-terminal domain
MVGAQGPQNARLLLDKTMCPNCRAASSCHPFYEVFGVPTNSCLLVEDRGQALRFPTGDIVLAVCRECGFIFNAAWHSERTIYSDQYEETQGFSPTFNRFNRAIAEELVSSYDIHGKTVLEIGCGKGEFLSLICNLGGNRGIGYDPSFVPARQSLDQNIRFVREFFTEKTTEIAPPDLLCCKMTLEHIGQTNRFLTCIRAVANRSDSIIFFQVPDVARILKEGAFWDVYYEHCSYFGATSVRSLFRGTGFSVRRIWTGYDDQYLMILGSPTEHGSGGGYAETEGVVAIVRSSATFSVVAGRRRAAWLTRLRSWAAAGQRTVLWGSGSKAVAFLTTLGVYDEVEYVIDINPHRVGKFLPGTAQRIVEPSFLREYRPDNVIIMNPIYLREIEQELARLRCEPSLYTILDLEPVHA